MSKRNTPARIAPTRAIEYFKPKPVVKRDELPWLEIFERKDFKEIGLCLRHVQIDGTGRDWYGMPLLIDPVAAPAQGLPYVMELKGDELQLNKYLWSLEYLSQGWEGLSSRLAYKTYLDKYKPGDELLTPQQHHEEHVRFLVECKFHPSPTIAQRVAACTRDENNEPDFEYDAEGVVVRSVPTSFEKLICLPYSSQVCASYEHLIQWKRQDIYYDRLVEESRRGDVLEAAARQAQSQAYWRQVDADRQAARAHYLATHAGELAVAIPTRPQQTDLFAEFTPPVVEQEPTHDIDYHDVTHQKLLSA